MPAYEFAAAAGACAACWLWTDRPSPRWPTATDGVAGFRTAGGLLGGFGAGGRVARRGRGPGGAIPARDFCSSFADELEAGSDPRTALLAASAVMGARIPRAVAAARLGDDVAAALERDAADCGSPLLASVASCWRVGERSGAGLAAGLRALAAAEAEATRIRGDLHAQVAAPRATARVLACLPLVGLLLGTLLGGSPVQWLCGGPLGWICLGAGALLTGAGVVWTNAIVRRSEALL